MKRYQVYLNPHNVGIFDEASEQSGYTRSKLMQEAFDGAASRLGNLLSTSVPNKKGGYTGFDKIIGSIQVKGKKMVYLSQNIDEIYYK